MEYKWTDASALYQMRYYNDNPVKGMSAELYLQARINGHDAAAANIIAND